MNQRTIGRLALMAVLFLQVILSSITPTRAVQDPSGSPPAREPEEQHWRTHDFDEQHLRLDVRFEPSQKKVIGKVTHTIKPLMNEFKRVELDAVGLQIAAVRLEGGKSLEFHTPANRLTIDLDRAYRAGDSITFTVEYTATSPKKGIYFIAPDPGYHNRPYQIWSQGEAEECRHWIPLYDHPNDKATTEALITVPRPFTAVSNGKLIEVVENRDGTKTFHWKQAKPHATYLITVTVADYVEIQDKPYQGIPVVYYVFESKAQDTPRSLGKTPAMIQYFSEKIGFPYPWEKYATVLANAFPGAMENTSATTMTDTAIHDERAALDVSSEDVASHELAHQWWGDTVTFRNWSDIWLSEGFASYFETVWEEHESGWDQASYSRAEAAQRYAGQTRQRNRPLVFYKHEDPDELFDATTYTKGAAVLHMLRFVLGDEGFWKSLNRYIHKNAFGNVETRDLKLAIEEATGENLDWFFDEWVYKAGLPEFEVSYRYDADRGVVKLRVQQTQKTDDQVPIFRMPVEIEIATAGSRKIHRIVVDKAEEEFSLKADAAPLLVNFDPRNWLLKTLKCNKSKTEWLYQLKSDSQVSNRIGAVRELKAFVAEDEVSSALRQSMLHDRFWAVRSQAAQALGEQEGERIRAALIDALKDPSSRVRRAALPGLGKYKDDATIALLKGIFESDPSYFAAAAAVSALSRIGGPKPREIILAALQRDSHQEVIRTAALNGLVAIKDERALSVAMEYSAYDKPTMLRTTAIRAMAQFGEGKEEVVVRLVEYLKDRSSMVRMTTVSALGSMGSERAIKPLEDFAKAESSRSLQDAARQAIERIQAAVKKSKETEKKAA